ncbi:MAG: co-chaperone DjlA [Pseudomonadota bacterium]
MSSGIGLLFDLAYNVYVVLDLFTPRRGSKKKSKRNMVIEEISQHNWINDTRNNRIKIQALFFSSIFSTLGYLSKIDGVSTQEERDFTNNFIAGLELSNKLDQLAKNLFKEGIRSDFNQIKKLVSTFADSSSNHNDFLSIFMEVLISAAYSDGKLHNQERNVLARVAKLLNISEEKLISLETYEIAQAGQTPSIPNSHKDKTEYEIACDFLGVSYSCNEDEAKNAYRKMINNYHPDKLESQGIPKDFINLTAKKTIAIRKAYEVILNKK